MVDANKIIEALQEKGEAAAERLRTDPNARNMAMAGAGGVLAGILAGKASPRFAGAVGRLGAMAALGGLAYYGWRKFQAQRSGQPGPDGAAPLEAPPQGFLPESDGANAKLVLRAMINAAKADGRIDSDERARLFDRLGSIHLTDEEQDFLFAELARPMDTEGLVREASASPGLAVQAYAASLLAINADLPAEKAYLQELAARLNMPPELVAELHAAAS